MTIAEELRQDAELALKGGGMCYSGEYLSGMASRAEKENDKLRKLVGELIEHVTNPPCEGCMAEMNCCAGLEDVSQCDEWSLLVDDARKLGIEVE